MYKSIPVAIFLFIFLIFNFTGCATFRKRDLELQALRNQIQALQLELNQKNEEISYLKGLLETKEKTETIKTYPIEAKSKPTVYQIQIALKNAGFDPGPIDGRMGRKTKEAIRAFQRANGLTPDGKVGRRTWGILREYLYKKVK
ncbi:MAG: peptidoglycan-binding protein [Candidatus Omnitrophica bacterium]|nr:peptidoglycan-binding protein [Candidatus Omnitrophota bacterium]